MQVQVRQGHARLPEISDDCTYQLITNSLPFLSLVTTVPGPGLLPT